MVLHKLRATLVNIAFSILRMLFYSSLESHQVSFSRRQRIETRFRKQIRTYRYKNQFLIIGVFNVTKNKKQWRGAKYIICQQEERQEEADMQKLPYITYNYDTVQQRQEADLQQPLQSTVLEVHYTVQQNKTCRQCWLYLALVRESQIIRRFLYYLFICD